MAGATELERLIVSLEASTVKYERALARANGQTANSMKRIERRVSQMGVNVGAGLSKAFAFFATGALANAAKDFIDANIRITNSLKLAGLQGTQLTDVYNQLFAAAQKNGAPFEALATLYGRVAQVQGSLGASTDDLLKFTDNVAASLRLTGRSAEESQGALLQLSQALSTGTVRAEEFNSVNEGLLPVLQAAARGIKEAGGSVATLRNLVLEGKISSKAFFDGFAIGAGEIQEKVGTAQMTIGQGFERLKNVLITAAGQFDNATGTSQALGTALDATAGFVEKLGKAFADHKGDIDAFFAAIANGSAQTSKFLEGKQSTVNKGETVFFDPIQFDPQKAYNDIASFFSGEKPIGIKVRYVDSESGLPVPDISTVPTNPNAKPVVAPVVPAKPLSQNELTFRNADYNTLRPAVKPISIFDDLYKTTGDKKTAEEKAFDTAQKNIKKQIADLEAEGVAARLNAVDQEVLKNIREAGATATADQIARIEELTRANYAEQEAVQYLQGLYETLGQAGQSAVQGIISALDDGKITLQEFGDIAANVLSQVGNFFLGQAFGNGTGQFQDILKGIFGGGRALGGPVEAGKVYKVNENTPNSEYFAPTQDGVIIPKLPKQGSGGASSAGGNVFHIDARGAQKGVGEEIRQALEHYDRYSLPKRVNDINKDPLARG